MPLLWVAPEVLKALEQRAVKVKSSAYLRCELVRSPLGHASTPRPWYRLAPMPWRKLGRWQNVSAGPSRALSLLPVQHQEGSWVSSHTREEAVRHYAWRLPL